jgi:hypothetical protein
MHLRPSAAKLLSADSRRSTRIPGGTSSRSQEGTGESQSPTEAGRAEPSKIDLSRVLQGVHNFLQTFISFRFIDITLKTAAPPNAPYSPPSYSQTEKE